MHIMHNVSCLLQYACQHAYCNIHAILQTVICMKMCPGVFTLILFVSLTHPLMCPNLQFMTKKMKEVRNEMKCEKLQDKFSFRLPSFKMPIRSVVVKRRCRCRRRRDASCGRRPIFEYIFSRRCRFPE